MVQFDGTDIRDACNTVGHPRVGNVDGDGRSHSRTDCPEIQENLNVSESSAGLIITTHGALIVLVSPIAGALIDHLGPRRPFIGGLLLYAVGGGVGLVIESFVPLLISRAVLGIGVIFVYTSTIVLIYDLYEGQRMNRVLGLQSSANSVGGVAWPLVGGALGTFSWQAPFGVYLIALPLGLLAIMTVPQTGENDASDQTGGETSGADGITSFNGTLHSWQSTYCISAQTHCSIVSLYFIPNS